MYDVVAMGESLIDFTPAGRNELEMPMFSQNPGGAPANVLAMNTKLGGRTAFLGKVGKDAFGTFLRDCMEKAGIDCSGLCVDDKAPTTLAFVQLDEQGDRSFTFYRDPGADLMMRPEDVNRTVLENCRIFHFGSVSLTGEPCRSTVLWAVQRARETGALISYDPNYRPFLWADEAAARQELRSAVELSDILKVSEEEMLLLTGETDLSKGADKLQALGPQVVFVTRGPDGAYFRTPEGERMLPAHMVQAVDTTGAGDAFWGALLAQIPGRGPDTLKSLSLTDWTQAARIANAAGSLTTMRKGGIPAMPDFSMIQSCLREIPLKENRDER